MAIPTYGTIKQRRLDRQRAGASGEQKFKELIDRWRHERRNRFALLYATLALPCLVAVGIGSGWFDIGASFLMGGWTGMFISVWDAPPEYIERRRRGFEGERQTAKALAALDREQWTVVHDIECRYGNWDHIVIGPPGVFLLDTKNLRGKPSIEDGCLVLRRTEDPDQCSRFDRLTSRMRGSAAALADTLRTDGARPWVTPVVVVWPHLSPSPSEINGVTHIGGNALLEWLATRPVVVAESRVQRLATRLNDVPKDQDSSRDDQSGRSLNEPARADS
jgi:hypothetical protein